MTTPKTSPQAAAMTAELSRETVERICRYAAIGTPSKEGAEGGLPSTPEQWELAKLLERELREMGLVEVKLDEQCYVYATLPANVAADVAAKIPPVAYIAHIDTAWAVPGADVKPMVHKKYQGGDLVLPGVVIKAAENPRLAGFIGDDIVTSDGTTLLGADDKAGIAAIMAALSWLKRHPEIEHGTIKVAFTPDEEIGRGAEGFDVAGLGAKYAYTVDGEQMGELNDETFCAATGTVTFTGKNCHPGFAKNIMINSVYAMGHFLSLFPADMRPETTEKKQGYLHPYTINGSEETTVVKVLLRDFDEAELNNHKKRLEGMVEQTRKAFPKVTISLKIDDSYRNMRVILKDIPFLVEYAAEAMKRVGVEPIMHGVRGGTDGSRLTFKGLPCPNLFTGAEKCHSREEWVAASAMGKSAGVIVELSKIWRERAK